jgi:small subunit ribosomal protein S17
MEAKTRKEKQVLQGIVVSDKMDKTIVVEIVMRKLHPLYKKYLTRSKKVKAHDETNDAKMGDVVRVVETRPLSKEKRWRLAEIVERAK